jgi:hypothetical protein
MQQVAISCGNIFTLPLNSMTTPTGFNFYGHFNYLAHLQANSVPPRLRRITLLLQREPTNPHTSQLGA